MHRDQRPEGGLAALDLLARQRLGDEVEPGAAVLLRDHDPEQPELGHALDHAQVEVVVDVVLDRVREHALVDERTHGVLNQPLLRGKVEVHGRESMEAPRPGPAPGRRLRARAARAAGHARLHPRHDRRAPARRRPRGRRRGRHLVSRAPRPRAEGRRGPAARRRLDARVVLGRAGDAGPAPPLGLRERRARPRAATGRHHLRRGRRPRAVAGDLRRLAGPRRPADEPGRPALARARPEPPLQARPGRRLDRPADRRRSPRPARS